MPDVLDKDIYVLDYPGEYPECKEFKGYDWLGVLILPPSELDLKNRLKRSNRENRIPGACLEYSECIEDIKNGFLDNWVVIINSKTEDFNEGIKAIFEKIHY